LQTGSITQMITPQEVPRSTGSTVSCSHTSSADIWATLTYTCNCVEVEGYLAGCVAEVVIPQQIACAAVHASCGRVADDAVCRTGSSHGDVGLVVASHWDALGSIQDSVVGCFTGGAGKGGIAGLAVEATVCADFVDSIGVVFGRLAPCVAIFEQFGRIAEGVVARTDLGNHLKHIEVKGRIGGGRGKGNGRISCIYIDNPVNSAQIGITEVDRVQRDDHLRRDDGRNKSKRGEGGKIGIALGDEVQILGIA